MTNRTKISAVISTYNRYEGLIQAIDSVRAQTDIEIEIVVVNDSSTDARYYTDRPSDVTWKDLAKNTREIFGYACLGHVRNVGISIAKGEYIAFLDDDDVWMPNKTHLQLIGMREKGVEMSCTEGLMGDSLYDPEINYPIYHSECHSEFCKQFFEQHYGSWSGKLPDIFTLDLIQRHNFVIHSSVMLKRSLLKKVGNYKTIPLRGVLVNDRLIYEDWDLWMRCLEKTDCLHINQPLVYLDRSRSAPLS